MKEKILKFKNNKILKIIGNIIYIMLFLIVLLTLMVVFLQRTTNNEVTIGGYRIFVVATGSMIPKYQVGDVLISKEISPEKIKIGDDIVYVGKEGSFKDKVVTHQVIFIEKENEDYKIITKGIANTGEDPEITQNEVLGKIVYKMKTMTFLQKIISNNYLFYFVIFVPIVLITYRQIRNAVLSLEEYDK